MEHPKIDQTHIHDLEADPDLDILPLEPVISIGSPVEKVETSPYGSRPACFRNTLQECLFVIVATFVVGEVSIVYGATLCMTSFIGTDLNMTSAEVTWISAAATLSSGSFLLFFGKVADLFGRRILLLSSQVGFVICLLAMGFSPNAIFLDVFMGLLGLCSAAAVPAVIGKLGAVYPTPSRRKNRAFACFSAGNPLGFIIGAFIGGVIMQIANWRTSFWVCAVIYFFFTIALWWTVPLDTEQKLGGFNRETFAKFDFIGTFLIITGVALFTSALTLASEAPQGWKTPYVIAFLVIGFILMAAFLYWQSICKHPLMPLGIWRDRNFSLLVFTLSMCFFSFTGLLFFVALLWQHVYHDSAIMVAVKLLPAAIGGILVNIIGALIMHRVSNKLLMIIGALGMTIACALLSATSTSISYWALTAPALVCSVIGADFEFIVTNMYVMSSLPSDQQSIAGGLLQTVSRLAATIGLAVQTSVFTSLGGASDGPGALLYRPYQATFWVGTSAAVIGLAATPFLTIGSQGGRKRPAETEVQRHGVILEKMG